MSEQADNVAVLKQAYASWSQNKGSCTDCWADIIADDLRMRSLSDGAEPVAFTAERNGKEQFHDYMNGLAADWDMLFYDMDDFVAEGDRVVAIGRISFKNKRTGKGFETPKVAVWRMKDGKAKEYYEFFDTAKIYAAAM